MGKNDVAVLFRMTKSSFETERAAGRDVEHLHLQLA